LTELASLVYDGRWEVQDQLIRQCIECGRGLRVCQKAPCPARKLEKLRVAISGLPEEERLSIRGSINSAINAALRPPPDPNKKPRKKAPSLMLRGKVLDRLREAALALPLEERLSLRGTINSGLRVNVGRNGGRPKDPKKKRCPCGTMTLKRAKTRKHYVDGKCVPSVK